MCLNLIPSTVALDLQHGHFVPNIQLSFVCFNHHRRTDTHALPPNDAVLVNMLKARALSTLDLMAWNSGCGQCIFASSFSFTPLFVFLVVRCVVQ
ncbi:hypothetical protein QQF64_014151 [Cirrhinus molitorella]|uniref:Uncharacterized protein n=1 Tax=Cirrhinus molitorella TaxID=172907 RepID=A0ABR3LUU7_9TELE